VYADVAPGAPLHRLLLSRFGETALVTRRTRVRDALLVLYNAASSYTRDKYVSAALAPYTQNVAQVTPVLVSGSMRTMRARVYVCMCVHPVHKNERTIVVRVCV
jgi:hypothetical protein